MFKKIGLGFAVVFIFLSFACAQVPHLINYQGRLTDKTGKPLEGAYDVTFKIYDAENGPGEMAPWEEKHQGMIIQKGIFSVLLGSVTNLDLPFDKPYFLEIKVGDEVMSPRQRIASVGYAIRAENAEKLKDASAIESGVVPSARLGSGSASADTVLRGDQTWSASMGWQNIQVFTSSGTWIKPAGVSKVYVEVLGGGGGGSSSHGGWEGGGSGGGSGGYSAKICTVTTDVFVIVGAGGDGGIPCGVYLGKDGEISSFGSFCSATGGSHGTFSTGGAPGSGIGGDINLTGGRGGDSTMTILEGHYTSPQVGGGGGGSSGTHGGNSSVLQAGHPFFAGNLMSGDNGGTGSSTGPGGNATVYGCGGGGAGGANMKGGNGYQGIVVVYY